MDQGWHGGSFGIVQKLSTINQSITMKLTRYTQPDAWAVSPFEQLNALQHEINRLFDLPFSGFGRGSELFSGWSPALDLYEDKDNLFVRVEVPGFRKEDLELSYHDGSLTISGERKAETKSEPTQAHRTERFLGRFHRSIALPKPVKMDRIKATYKDGVLAVTLPKTEEARPKQIEVQVS